MSLPKLDSEEILHTCELPSSGEHVSFRPYKVKEEKVLLLAAESKSSAQIFDAIVNLLSSCIVKPERFDINNITTFDMEYLFLKIRCLSVGETVPLSVACEDKECNKTTDISLDLANIKIEDADNVEKNKVIDLTDSISIKVHYPNIEIFKGGKISFDDMDSVTSTYEVIASCISEVLTSEEVFNFKDTNRKEQLEFVESMSPVQVAKISKYMQTVPSIVTRKKFTCECGLEQELVLKGLNDFFSQGSLTRA